MPIPTRLFNKFLVKLAKDDKTLFKDKVLLKKYLDMRFDRFAEDAENVKEGNFENYMSLDEPGFLKQGFKNFKQSHELFGDKITEDLEKGINDIGIDHIVDLDNKAKSLGKLKKDIDKNFRSLTMELDMVLSGYEKGIPSNDKVISDLLEEMKNNDSYVKSTEVKAQRARFRMKYGDKITEPLDKFVSTEGDIHKELLKDIKTDKRGRYTVAESGKKIYAKMTDEEMENLTPEELSEQGAFYDHEFDRKYEGMTEKEFSEVPELKDAITKMGKILDLKDEPKVSARERFKQHINDSRMDKEIQKLGLTEEDIGKMHSLDNVTSIEDYLKKKKIDPDKIKSILPYILAGSAAAGVSQADTSEAGGFSRRGFLKALGLGGASLAGLSENPEKLNRILSSKVGFTTTVDEFADLMHRNPDDVMYELFESKLRNIYKNASDKEFNYVLGQVYEKGDVFDDLMGKSPVQALDFAKQDFKQYLGEGGLKNYDKRFAEAKRTIKAVQKSLNFAPKEEVDSAIDEMISGFETPGYTIAKKKKEVGKPLTEREQKYFSKGEPKAIEQKEQPTRKVEEPIVEGEFQVIPGSLERGNRPLIRKGGKFKLGAAAGLTAVGIAATPDEKAQAGIKVPKGMIKAYHGTSETFSKFKKGFNFFTTIPEHAESFAVHDPQMRQNPAKGTAGPNIRPVYLDIRKPFEFSDYYIPEDIDKAIRADPKAMAVLQKEFGGPITEDDMFDATASDVGMKVLVDKVKELGYDGLHFKSATGSDELVPFDNKQIRDYFNPKKLGAIAGLTTAAGVAVSQDEEARAGIKTPRDLARMAKNFGKGGKTPKANAVFEASRHYLLKSGIMDDTSVGLFDGFFEGSLDGGLPKGVKTPVDLLEGFHRSIIGGLDKNIEDGFISQGEANEIKANMNVLESELSSFKSKLGGKKLGAAAAIGVTAASQSEAATPEEQDIEADVDKQLGVIPENASVDDLINAEAVKQGLPSLEPTEVAPTMDEESQIDEDVSVELDKLSGVDKAIKVSPEKGTFTKPFTSEELAYNEQASNKRELTYLRAKAEYVDPNEPVNGLTPDEQKRLKFLESGKPESELEKPTPEGEYKVTGEDLPFASELFRRTTGIGPKREEAPPEQQAVSLNLHPAILAASLIEEVGNLISGTRGKYDPISGTFVRESASTAEQMAGVKETVTGQSMPFAQEFTDPLLTQFGVSPEPSIGRLATGLVAEFAVPSTGLMKLSRRVGEGYLMAKIRRDNPNLSPEIAKLRAREIFRGRKTTQEPVPRGAKDVTPSKEPITEPRTASPGATATEPRLIGITGADGKHSMVDISGMTDDEAGDFLTKRYIGARQRFQEQADMEGRMKAAPKAQQLDLIKPTAEDMQLKEILNSTSLSKDKLGRVSLENPEAAKKFEEFLDVKVGKNKSKRSILKRQILELKNESQLRKAGMKGKVAGAAGATSLMGLIGGMVSSGGEAQAGEPVGPKAITAIEKAGKVSKEFADFPRFFNTFSDDTKAAMREALGQGEDYLPTAKEAADMKAISKGSRMGTEESIDAEIARISESKYQDSTAFKKKRAGLLVRKEEIKKAKSEGAVQRALESGEPQAGRKMEREAGYGFKLDRDVMALDKIFAASGKTMREIDEVPEDLAIALGIKVFNLPKQDIIALRNEDLGFKTPDDILTLAESTDKAVGGLDATLPVLFHFKGLGLTSPAIREAEKLVTKKIVAMDKRGVPIPDEIIHSISRFEGFPKQMKEAAASLRTDKPALDSLSDAIAGAEQPIKPGKEDIQEILASPHKFAAQSMKNHMMNMDLSDIPEGTTFYTRRGTGNPVKFAMYDKVISPKSGAVDASLSNVIMSYTDAEGQKNLILRPNQFRLNMSPLKFNDKKVSINEQLANLPDTLVPRSKVFRDLRAEQKAPADIVDTEGLITKLGGRDEKEIQAQVQEAPEGPKTVLRKKTKVLDGTSVKPRDIIKEGINERVSKKQPSSVKAKGEKIDSSPLGKGANTAQAQKILPFRDQMDLPFRATSGAAKLEAIAGDVQLAKAFRGILGLNIDIYNMQKTVKELSRKKKLTRVQKVQLKQLQQEIQDKVNRGFKLSTDFESLFENVFSDTDDILDFMGIKASILSKTVPDGTGHIRIGGPPKPPLGEGDIKLLPPHGPDGPDMKGPYGENLSKRDMSTILTWASKFLSPLTMFFDIAKRNKMPEFEDLAYQVMRDVDNGRNFLARHRKTAVDVKKETPNADPVRVFGILNGKFVKNVEEELIDASGRKSYVIKTVDAPELERLVNKDDIKRAFVYRQILEEAPTEVVNYSGKKLDRRDDYITHVGIIMDDLGFVPYDVARKMLNIRRGAITDITPRVFRKRPDIPVFSTNADHAIDIALLSYRTLFKRPSVLMMKKMMEAKDVDGAPIVGKNLSNYLRNYAEHYMGNANTSTKFTNDMTGAVRLLGYADFIAGNLSFIFFNAMQPILALPLVGPKHWIMGLRDAIVASRGYRNIISKTPDTRAGYLHEFGIQSRLFGDPGKLVSELEDLEGFIPRARDLIDIVGYLANKTENVNKYVTLYMGRRHGLELGLRGDRLIDHAKGSIVRPTQMRMGIEDRPPVFRGPVNSAMFQFLSFTTKYMFDYHKVLLDELAKGKPSPLMYYLTMLTFLGGPAAIPLMDTAMGLTGNRDKLTDWQASFPSLAKFTGIDFASRIGSGGYPSIDIVNMHYPLGPGGSLAVESTASTGILGQDAQDKVLDKYSDAYGWIPWIEPIAGLQMQRFAKAHKDVQNDLAQYSRSGKMLTEKTKAEVIRGALGVPDFNAGLRNRYLRDLEEAERDGDTDAAAHAAEKASLLGARGTISEAIRRGKAARTRVRRRGQYFKKTFKQLTGIGEED